MAKKKKAAGKPKPKTKPAKKRPAKKAAAKKTKSKGAAGIESIEGEERHAMEPKANSQGYFDQGVEEILILVSDTEYAKIEVVQASNGKWVYGLGFMVGNTGFGRALDVFGSEWDTRYQAIWNACDELLGKLKQRKHDKLRNKVKDFQAALTEDGPAAVATPGMETASARDQSNVEIKTLDREGNEKQAPEVDPHDSELLDEIEALADSCKEAEAELVNAKEIVKARKKIYEGRCVDLLRKIAERKGDADRPLLKDLDKPKQSRAEEIAGREATTPMETDAGSANPAHQMDWQKTPTTELHLQDCVERMSKELAEKIEANYPTLGEFVDLHQQGTGKGQGIRSIVGVGPKMADRIIELLDDWLAKVRDGWGAPAAGHEDFTGENAPADEDVPEHRLAGGAADLEDIGEDPTDLTTPAEEAAIAGPSEVDLSSWWQALQINELDLPGRILRKLQGEDFVSVGDLENYLAEGGVLDTIGHLTPDEASTLAEELQAGRDLHHQMQRLKHNLLSGAEPYEVHELGVSEAFDEGLRAGKLGVTSLFAEARERSGNPGDLHNYLAGFVHGGRSEQQSA